MKFCIRRWFAIVVLAVFTAGCLGTDQPTEDVEPPPLVNYRSVAVGDFHTCGVTTQRGLYCWGENQSGKLGTGDTDWRFAPWPVSHGNTEFTEVSPGGSSTCALSTEQEVFCWGANEVGQLGMGTITDFLETEPTEAVGGGHNFVMVSTGGVHVCAIDDTRQAFCWGYSDNGRLGNGVPGGQQPRPNPDSVLGGHSFEMISSGTHHTCGVTLLGDAYCWGLGTSGQLGNGDNNSSSVPVLVVGGHQFSVVDAGSNHSCATGIDGDAYCWGQGFNGQLGNGGVVSSNIPVLVSGGLTFESISAGGQYTCGLVNTGDAYCWGRNGEGELGDSTYIAKSAPVQVVGGIRFESIGAGGGTTWGTATCARGQDDRLLYCWGDGTGGQTGNGIDSPVHYPVLVEGQGTT